MPTSGIVACGLLLFWTVYRLFLHYALMRAHLLVLAHSVDDYRPEAEMAVDQLRWARIVAHDALRTYEVTR